MKRFKVIYLLVIFTLVFINANVYSDDLFATDLWFTTSEGSSWTYQRDNGTLFTVRMHEKVLDLDSSGMNSFNYSTLEGDFFNTSCSNEGDNGPFGTFQILSDIYGFAGHGTAAFIRDLMNNWFVKKGGTMTAFFVWDTLTGEQIACDPDKDDFDSIASLNKWHLFDYCIENTWFNDQPWTWFVAVYYGKGTLFDIPQTLKASCFGRLVIGDKGMEEVKGYGAAYKVEFGATIYVGELQADEAIFNTFWLVSRIGPVKIRDNISGTGLLLKSYNIIDPHSWEKPGGQAVNPGSGKIATTWGRIKASR